MGAGFFGCERWPVFYEDNHLLALYKPAGLLSQADSSRAVDLLGLAKAWIKERHRKPGRVFLGLVQRLDRPVAGVMLFARTSKAAARISAQLRSHQVRKLYLAVVEGTPQPASGRLEHIIERGEHAGRIVVQPTSCGRAARLFYRQLASAGGRSLLEVELETGRKHQIRLQLAHIGCPIVGDVRYGASAALPSQPIALLAYRLEVAHPTRGEMLSFTSPVPSGWPWPGLAPPEGAPFWNWADCPASVRRRAGIA